MKNSVSLVLKLPYVYTNKTAIQGKIDRGRCVLMITSRLSGDFFRKGGGYLPAEESDQKARTTAWMRGVS